MSELNQMLKKLATLKRRKSLADAKAKAITNDYEEARTEVLGLMNQEKLDSARCGKTSCTVSTQQIVEVVDWEEYYKWMFKKKAMDALQRRVAQRAILDRREAGEEIPGVKVSKLRKLNVTIAK